MDPDSLHDREVIFIIGVRLQFSNTIPPHGQVYKSSLGDEAVINYNPNTGSILGTLKTPDSRSFIIERCNASYVIKEFDVKSFFDKNDDAVFSGKLIRKTVQNTKRTKREIRRISRGRGRGRGRGKGNKEHWTYSLMVYYTPEFAAVTPDIEDFIDEMLDITNQGYRNSKMPITVVKFCSELATINENAFDPRKDLLKTFEYMKGTTTALRNTADAAILLVDNILGGYCGQGYLSGFASGRPLSWVRKSCAIGGYTVGHELGHNLGAHHNPEQDNNIIFRNGHGHLIERGEHHAGLHTIMAYQRDGHWDQTNYYSNPDVIHPQTGTRTGVRNLSNNAAVILNNVGKLAALGDESGSCGASCDPGWTYFKHTGKCYKYVSKKNSLYKAYESCKRATAKRTLTLASIHDETTNTFLATLSKQRAWIGGLKMSSGTWGWLDRSEWNYSNWGPGKPSNWRRHRNNLQINFDGPGLWNNAPKWRKLGALCQY